MIQKYFQKLQNSTNSQNFIKTAKKIGYSLQFISIQEIQILNDSLLSYYKQSLDISLKDNNLFDLLTSSIAEIDLKFISFSKSIGLTENIIENHFKFWQKFTDEIIFIDERNFPKTVCVIVYILSHFNIEKISQDKINWIIQFHAKILQKICDLFYIENENININHLNNDNILLLEQIVYFLEYQFKGRLPIEFQSVLMKLSSLKLSTLFLKNNEKLYFRFFNLRSRFIQLLFNYLQFPNDSDYIPNLVSISLKFLRDCPYVCFNSHDSIITSFAAIYKLLDPISIKKINKFIYSQILNASKFCSCYNLPIFYIEKTFSFFFTGQTNLSKETLAGIADLYIRNMHDESFPLTTQAISIRFLLKHTNWNNFDPYEELNFLFKIFQSITNKFSSLKQYIISIHKKSLIGQYNENNQKEFDPLSMIPFRNEIDYEPIVKDTISNCKQTIILFLEELSFVLQSIKRILSQNPYLKIKDIINSSAFPLISFNKALHLTSKGRYLFQKIFKNSISCFLLLSSAEFEIKNSGKKNENQNQNQNQKQFSTENTCYFVKNISHNLSLLNVGSFKFVIRNNLDFILNFIQNYDDTKTLFYAFFSSEILPSIIDILFRYILKNLHIIIESQPTKKQIIFDLFTFILESTRDFSFQIRNRIVENVMKRYLPSFIQQIFKLIQGSEDPSFLLNFLSMIFSRSKKFPELEDILLSFTSNIFKISKNLTACSELNQLEITKLCLSIPLKIPFLFSYLSSFTKRLVHALNTKDPKLIQKSLYILQFFVDNIQLDFLFSKIKEEESSLAKAIIQHLDPKKGHLGFLAAKIIGKMGHYNRSFLFKNEHHFENLKPFNYQREVYKMVLKFKGDSNQENEEQLIIQLDKCLDVAINIINDEEKSTFSKSKAFDFIRAFTYAVTQKFFFDTLVISEQFKNAKSEETNSFFGFSNKNVYENSVTFWFKVEGFARFNLKKALIAIYKSQLDENLCSESKKTTDFIMSVYVKSIILQQKININEKEEKESYFQINQDVNKYSNPLINKNRNNITETRSGIPEEQSSRYTFIDSLIETSSDFKYYQIGVDITTKMIDMITYNQDPSVYADFVVLFLQQAIHFCYLPEFNFKFGGVNTLSVLCPRLTRLIKVEYQNKIISALILVIKDTISKYSFIILKRAETTLTDLIYSISSFYYSEKQESKNNNIIEEQDLFKENNVNENMEIEMEIEMEQEYKRDFFNNEEEIDQNIQNIPKVFVESISLLLQELFSHKRRIRIIIKEILKIAYESNQEDNLCIFTDFIKKFLSKFNWDENNYGKNIRVLDGISFMLNLNPKILSSSKSYLYLILQKSIIYIDQIQEKQDEDKKKLNKRFIHDPNIACLIKFITEIFISKILNENENENENNHKINIETLFSLLFSSNDEISAQVRMHIKMIEIPEKISEPLFEKFWIQRKKQEFKDLTQPLLININLLAEIFPNFVDPSFCEFLVEILKNKCLKIKQEDINLINIIVSIISHTNSEKYFIDIKDSIMNLQAQLQDYSLWADTFQSFILYFNKFSQKTIEYFLSKECLDNKQEIYCFISIFYQEKAQNLHNGLIERSQEFIDIFFNELTNISLGDQKKNYELLESQKWRFGLELMQILFHFSSNKFVENKLFMNTVITFWKIYQFSLIEQSDFYRQYEPESFARIIIFYLKLNKDIDILFQLAQFFQMKSLIDYQSIKNFFFKEAPKIFNDYKEMILDGFLKNFKNAKTLNKIAHSTCEMRALIIPLLLNEFTQNNGESNVSNKVLEIINDSIDIFSNFSYSYLENDEKINFNQDIYNYENYLITKLVKYSFQLIYLVTFEKIKSIPNLFMKIMEFLWFQTGSINIKIREETYSLLIQAIELIKKTKQFPLYIRLYQLILEDIKKSNQEQTLWNYLKIVMRKLENNTENNINNKNFPEWTLMFKEFFDHEKFLKNIYKEKPPPICQFIIEEEDIFYKYKDLFTFPIIEHIQNLEITRSNLDCGFELIYIIINWKIKSNEKEKDLKNIMEIESNLQKQTQLNEKYDAIIFHKLNKLIFNFLIKERSFKRDINRWFDLIEKSFEGWANISISFPDIIGNFPNENNPFLWLSNTVITILCILSKHQPISFLLKNGKELAAFLNTILITENKEIVIKVCYLLKNLLKQITNSSKQKNQNQNQQNYNDNDMRKFSMTLKQIIQVIEKKVAPNTDPRTNIRKLFGVSEFFRTVYYQIPNYLDQHLPDLLLYFEQVIVVHIDHVKKPININEESQNDVVNSIRDCFFMLSFRINNFPYLRKRFLRGVRKIILQCGDFGLIFDVFKVIKNWIIDKNLNENQNENKIFEDSFKTKDPEKLQKITGWENFHDRINISLTLEEKLKFISDFTAAYRNIEIRNNPNNPELHQLIFEILLECSKLDYIENTDIFLEQILYLGFVSQNKKTKDQFFQIIHQKMPKNTLRERILFVILSDIWKPKIPTWINEILKLSISLYDPEALCLGSIFTFFKKKEINNEFNDLQINAKVMEEKIQKLLFIIPDRKYLKIRELIEPIIDLIDEEPQMIQALWPSLFSQFWGNILNNDEERRKVAVSLVDFLLKESYIINRDLCKVILDGFLYSEPRVRISIQKIKNIAKQFGHWYIAVAMMEAYHSKSVGLLTHAKNIREVEEIDEANCELSVMFMQLGEIDLMYGLWDMISVNQETKQGIAFVQHGMWKQAQEYFLKSMGKVESKFAENNPGKGELGFSEEQWIYCSQIIGDYSTLLGFSEKINHSELLLDSAWNLGKLKHIARALKQNSQTLERAQQLLYQGYLFYTQINLNIIEAKFKNFVRNPIQSNLNEQTTFESINQNRNFQKSFLFKKSTSENDISNLKTVVDQENSNNPNTNEERPTRKISFWDEENANNKTNSVNQESKENHNTNKNLNGYQTKIETDENEKQRIIKTKQKMRRFDSFETFEFESLSDIIHLKAAYQEGILYLITEWDTLPKNLSNLHIRFLQKFQPFIEFFESIKVFKIIKNSLENNTKTEMEHFLTMWKNRIPDIHEELSIWNNLFVWRFHIFGNIERVSKFNIHNKFENMAIYQSAKALILIAKIFRKQGLPNNGIRYLDRIHTFSIVTTNDMFQNLKEKTKCCLEVPNRIPEFLQFLNDDQLNNFPDHNQRSTLKRCQAELYSKLSFFQEANEKFYQSTKISQFVGSNWKAWGKFCDQMWKKTKNISWVKEAIKNYIQTMIFGEDKQADIAPRIIYLSRYENMSDETIPRLLINDTPIYVWVIWIPQLISEIIQRNHIPIYKNLLAKISLVYPQAVYYHLRSSIQQILSLEKLGILEINLIIRALNDIMKYLKQNEIIKKKMSKKTNFEESSTEQIDNIIRSVISNFQSALSDEFLNDLDKIYYKIINSCETFDGFISLEDIQEVIKKYSQEKSLKEIFEFSEIIKLEKKNPELSKIKVSEIRDIIRATTASLRRLFRSNMENKYVEDFDFALSQSRFEDNIEVPGQYLEPNFYIDKHRKIYCIHPEFQSIMKSNVVFRKIKFVDNCGDFHDFIVERMSYLDSRSEERVIQFMRILNIHLDKYYQTKKRGIKFTLPVILPLTKDVRIFKGMSDVVSFSEVCEDYFYQKGIYFENPIIYHFNKISKFKKLEEKSTEKNEMKKKQYLMKIFQKIQNKFVPPPLFHLFMFSMFSSVYETWVFRKQFTIQHGLNSLIKFLFSIEDKTINRIYFDRTSGKLIHTRMNMKIESDELLYEYKPNDVPMRLTPNIIGFMSNIGVEGTFSVVLTCSSLCFTKKEFTLENCLNLIIKDEMFSKRIEKVISNENYQTKISNYNQIDDYLIIDENFLDKMEKNVEKILNRINLLSPKESLENLNQNQNQNQKPINWYAKELIYHCSNIENISLIKPNFFPWF